jgi:hypothetical protein
MSGCNCNNSLKPCGNCGCINCPPGAPGADGNDGLSAYEVWLGEGNVGTEQDFLDSLVGPPGEDGEDGTDGIGAHINFYQEEISTVEVNITTYHFPTGYGGLSYTNATGATKTYIVHISYEERIDEGNTDSLGNYIQSAIIKTVAAVDTPEYERDGSVTIVSQLYDGVTTGVGDIVDRSGGTANIYADTGEKVEHRFGFVRWAFNTSYFKRVTLNDGESVSLKFKVPEPGVNATLLQAQIFVLEIG